MKTCPECRLEYRDDARTHCVVDGAALESSADPRIGRLLAGRFVVAEPIGVGGMATVYRGEEATTGRAVAIKVMHHAQSSDRDLRERFRREARNAAAISHENVVEIFDAGQTEDGHPFLVMELLEGQPLRTVVTRALPLWFVLSIGVQVAKGLARAHDLGITHRDLKPENVFVAERDGVLVAKLVDFGIARARDDERLTMAGAILGTPAYIAPERVRGGEGGASADLYALGIVLFEMLAGKLPFASESLEGFLFHHLESEPPRLGTFVAECPAALESLVQRLLAKSPRERPVDAHQVVRELSSLRDAVSPRASRVSRMSLLGPVTVPSGTAPSGTARSGTEPSGTAPSGMAREPLSDRGPAVGAEPTRSSPGTVGYERWVRRALVLESMVRRAYASRAIPAAVAEALTAFKAEVVRVEALRATRSVEQGKLERMTARSRDARERLGKAVHALGRDLSEARETLEELRAELARRENEVLDLEFQLGALRGKLGEAESDAALERAETERVLLETGRETEDAQRVMGESARAIVAALRELPGGEGIVLELD